MYSEGLFSITKYNNKSGYYNTQGEEVIKCTYGTANEFRNGYAIVFINNKNDDSGISDIINTDGVSVIPKGIKKPSSIEQNGIYYLFSYDTENGCDKLLFNINTKKTMQFKICNLVPKNFHYKDFYNVKNPYTKFAATTSESEIKKCVLFDVNSDVVSKFEAGDIGTYSNGIVAAMKDWQWGCFDSTGKQILDYSYSQITPVSNNLAVGQKNGKYGLIDLKTKQELNFNYDFIESSTFDFCVAKQNGKFCIINRKGDFICLTDYGYVELLSNNIAKVENTGKYGLYNIKLKKEITKIDDYQFQIIDDNNILIFDRVGKSRVIDETGKIKFEFSNPNVNYIENQKLFFTHGTEVEATCYIDLNGKKYAE